VARLQVIATGALWSMNRLVEIGRRVEDALASDAVSPLLRTRLTAAGTLSLVQTGTSADAATAADAALSNARRCGDEPAQRFALLALSVVARQEGRHSEAHRRIRSLRALAGAEHLAEEVRALQMLDRYDEAAILLAQARRDLPDGIDAAPDLVHAQMWQDVNLGRIEDAEAQAHTLVRLSDELGEHVSTLDAGSVLSFTAMVRGDVTQARERLAAYSRPGPDDVAIRATAVALMRGWIALVTGDVAESVSAYRPLLDTARTSREYWPWFPLWMRPFVLAGVAAGDHAFAAEAASIAATGAERNPGVASFAGLALQTRGLVDDDPDLLGQAVDVLRTSPRPLLLASALADHGTALLTTDRDTAIGRLDAARGVYERVGATLPGAAVARAMVDAGARPTRPARGGPRPPSGWAALTDTELKVAELVGAGHSNRSAAADLGVSVNTVGTHLRAVFAKLDVRSRVQLANVLHERA
jgi:DNA-binding CsgD family transcriptional regulator